MASYAARMREVKDEAPTGKKEDGLSLQELSEQTGVEQRTIRSYVERGLLPGPESLGRGARYPHEALDRLRVMQLLREIARDHGRTVVVVTHDPRVYRYADRMAEMEDGRILRVLNTPAEIAAAHHGF